MSYVDDQQTPEINLLNVTFRRRGYYKSCLIMETDVVFHAGSSQLMTQSGT